jgi:hypothetical protein
VKIRELSARLAGDTKLGVLKTSESFYHPFYRQVPSAVETMKVDTRLLISLQTANFRLQANAHDPTATYGA